MSDRQVKCDFVESDARCVLSVEHEGPHVLKRAVAAPDAATREGKSMNYQVVADKKIAHDWRVEGIGAEGECHVTIFSGPDAESRAREYAVFKSTEPPKLERYNCYDPGSGYRQMIEDEDGDWVRFKDVASRTAALEAER